MGTKINLLISGSLRQHSKSHHFGEPTLPAEENPIEGSRDFMTCMCRTVKDKEGEYHINSTHCEIHKNQGGNENA